MGGGGDDGVHLPSERHSGGGFDGGSCDSSGPHGAAAVGFRIARAEPPGTDADLVGGGGKRGDLILGPDHDDVRRDRLSQRTGGDLGTDPPRVAQRNRDARARLILTF